MAQYWKNLSKKYFKSLLLSLQSFKSKKFFFYLKKFNFLKKDYSSTSSQISNKLDLFQGFGIPKIKNFFLLLSIEKKISSITKKTKRQRCEKIFGSSCNQKKKRLVLTNFKIAILLFMTKSLKKQ